MRKKKSRKITKKQLLRMACGRHTKRIERHWPPNQRKMSMAEIFIKARELGLPDIDLYLLLYNHDYKRWREVRSTVPRWADETIPFLVSSYLDLYR